MGKRMNLDPYLTPYTKVNSKEIYDLNIRPKTTKLLEENTREKLYDIGLGNDFLDMTSKSQTKENKNRQMAISNFKMFMHRNIQSIE